MDEEDKHYCHCQAGYTGSYCEDEVDECSPNPCQNGATCTDYLGGFSCKVWTVLGLRGGYGCECCYRRAVELGAGVSWQTEPSVLLEQGVIHLQDPFTLQMCWRRNMTSSGLGTLFLDSFMLPNMCYKTSPLWDQVLSLPILDSDFNLLRSYLGSSG